MTQIGQKQSDFMEAIQDAPVIAALKSDEGLEKALQSDCTTVFFPLWDNFEYCLTCTAC